MDDCDKRHEKRHGLLRRQTRAPGELLEDLLQSGHIQLVSQESLPPQSLRQKFVIFAAAWQCCLCRHEPMASAQLLSQTSKLPQHCRRRMPLFRFQEQIIRCQSSQTYRTQSSGP